MTVKISRLQTFDSSATPTFGEEPREPMVLASVDLAAMGDRLLASTDTGVADGSTSRGQKRASAEQTRLIDEQRQRIADLEREVAAQNLQLQERTAYERFGQDVAAAESAAMRMINAPADFAP